MEERKESQVKQPWECMGDAFKQVANLFQMPAVKKEEKKEEVKHD